MIAETPWNQTGSTQQSPSSPKGEFYCNKGWLATISVLDEEESHQVSSGYPVTRALVRLERGVSAMHVSKDDSDDSLSIYAKAWYSVKINAIPLGQVNSLIYLSI